MRDENEKDVKLRKIIYFPYLDCLKNQLIKDETDILYSRANVWRVISQMGFKCCINY